MTDERNNLVTEYRINRLEEIVEKLAENQLMLTRIESMGVENQRSIEKLYHSVVEQQKDTKILQLKINTIESQMESVTWINKIIASAVILAIVGAVLASIGLPS